MSPRRTIPEKKKQKTGLPSWVIIAAVAVVVLVVIAIGVDLVSKLGPAPAEPTSVSATGITRAGRTQGDPNAPLTLVEYSDFQ